MDGDLENWVVGRGIEFGLCRHQHYWLNCLPVVQRLDVLGCWVDPLGLIVIKVHWQPDPGIAMYSVFLQGGRCKIGG